MQQLVPTITLADVNKLASNWITDDNRVIIAQSPEKDGVKVPTQAELLAVFQRANTATVAAYTENLSKEALLANVRPAGTITASRVDSGGERHRVEAVERRARAGQADGLQGGRSAVRRVQPGRERRSRRTPTTCRRAWRRRSSGVGGLGQFNRIDLQKKLTGKVASARRVDRRDDRRVERTRVAEGSRDDVPADLSRFHGAASRSRRRFRR